MIHILVSIDSLKQTEIPIYFVNPVKMSLTIIQNSILNVIANQMFLIHPFIHPHHLSCARCSSEAQTALSQAHPPAYP